jgi:hypothetical protein
MFGPIDGMELQDGFNPFAAGKLASSAIDRLVAVDQAKTKGEYQAALNAVTQFDRGAMAAHRGPFIDSAQRAGVNATAAAAAFDKLEEGTGAALQLARELPTIHRTPLDSELAFRIDGLSDEWERWCTASVMNQSRIGDAMQSVIAAVNATDAIAAAAWMAGRPTKSE